VEPQVKLGIETSGLCFGLAWSLNSQGLGLGLGLGEKVLFTSLKGRQ